MVFFVMFTIDPKHDFNAAMGKFRSRTTELKLELMGMTPQGFLHQSAESAAEIHKQISSALPDATPLLVTRLQGNWSRCNLDWSPDRHRWINDRQIKHS
jgi:hypothetical protein